MEQQNNNTKNTTTEKQSIFKNNATWDTVLGDLEAWHIARRNLDKWLDEAETGAFGSFFESKTNRTAPFSLQNLAIVCHTSSGYIGDLVRKAKTKGMEEALKNHTVFDEASCYISLILDCLAPNLAEERAKREAERQAKLAEKMAKRAAVEAAIASIRETWEQFDIPATADNIRKIAPKTLAKENGSAILFYLAYEVLTDEEARKLVMELNITDCEDIYSEEV